MGSKIALFHTQSPSNLPSQFTVITVKKSVNFEALHTVPRASGSKGTPVSRRAASRTPPYPLGAPYRWLRQPASTLEKTQCPGLALAPGSTPFRTRSGGPRSTRPTLRFLGDGSKRANGACRDHVFRSPRLADGLAFLCFSINISRKNYGLTNSLLA